MTERPLNQPGRVEAMTGSAITVQFQSDASGEVIPNEIKDSADVQRLLENNLKNPELFEDEAQFTRDE